MICTEQGGPHPGRRRRSLAQRVIWSSRGQKASLCDYGGHRRCCDGRVRRAHAKRVRGLHETHELGLPQVQDHRWLRHRVHEKLPSMQMLFFLPCTN